MGNSIHVLRANRRSSSDEKILRIVKADGKVLEYRESVIVRDLLMNFDGFGVGTSKKASHHLPSNQMLMAGRVYYLLPLDAPINGCSSVPHTSGVPYTSEGKGEVKEEGGCKRIKVVLTKQQLQQLLSMNMSVEEMLYGIERRVQESFGSSTSWRPQLHTIPEGIEYYRRTREGGSVYWTH